MIPLTIKVIKDWAFYKCWGLTTVILNDGLEEIGEAALYGCASLEGIKIPPSVKDIKYQPFCLCSVLTTVILNNGLEEGGILWMQVPRRHRDTPRHQSNQGSGILELLGVDECGSQRWAG